MHEATTAAAAVCKPTIGIRGVEYYFDEIVPIDTLPRFAANPEMLEKFKRAGYQSVSVSHVSITEQAILSARKTLAGSGLAAADIDAVVIGMSELRDWSSYPEVASTQIMLGLGLKDIPVVGVTLAGCANYGSALRMVRNMIAVDGYRNVLVIETNQVRGETERIYSATGNPGFILGDGAVSFLATPANGDFKVLGMEQIVKPLDGATADVDAYVVNNISGFRHVTERALAQAGVRCEQVDKVFLHNIRFAALSGFLSALNLPRAKLFTDNIARTSHVWGADNLIGLYDYCAGANPPAGSIFLMLCQADFYYSAVVCQKL
jgi:3-oxoacyl-[acyl-carrier-protein] synthase-3